MNHSNFILKYGINKFPINEIFTIIVLCLAGIGPGSILLSTFVMFALFAIAFKNTKFASLSITCWLGTCIWVCFLLLYYFRYITPYMPNNLNGRLDFWFFLLKAIPSFSIYLIIISSRRLYYKFLYTLSLTLGCLLVALLNSIATLIFLDPPYYGKAYEFISGSIMNSPGTTILSSLTSLLLISFASSKTIKNPIYILLLICTSMLAIAINVIFVARSYFFLLIVVLFLKFFSVFISKKFNEIINKYNFFLLVLSLILVSIVFLLNYSYFISVFNRIIYGDYAVKFLHTVEYFRFIREDFFSYPLSYYYRPEQFWFHNYFFDVHRTSGPITALVNYFLLFLIIIKGIINIISKHSFSKEIIIFFIVFFLYLITSIPWESSEYQMIFVYSAISAMILSSKKKVSYLKAKI